MLNLKNKVVLCDEVNEKYYILGLKEAIEHESNNGRYSIIETDLTKWKYISSEPLETGYIQYTYLDNDDFDVTIIESLWTSGETKISNLKLA